MKLFRNAVLAAMAVALIAGLGCDDDDRGEIEGPEEPEGPDTPEPREVISCDDPPEELSSCFRDHSCLQDQRCVNHPEVGPTCVTLCGGDDEEACGDGEICMETARGQGWCVPGDDALTTGKFLFPEQCVCAVDGLAVIDFEVHDEAQSYMLVPYVYGGGTFEPLTIELPDSGVVDLQGENFFQLYGLEYPELQWLKPMVFPPAPRFADQLQAGVHRFELTTDEEQVCYYLIEDFGPATTLDLNIYLVGLDGLDLNAENAEEHEDFRQIMDGLDQIFGQIDIEIGEVRYKTVDPDIEESYRIVRDYFDAYDLVGFSEYPDHGIDGALSLNLFFVERFTDGTVGVAMGIPGAAGVHASLVSGVAISGEYIGVDDDHNFYTAVVTAHEIGHFLGLFHTSEESGAEFDNLEDTPECTDFDEMWSCPDAKNLMFPYTDFDTIDLTADQATVMRANPLIR